MKWGDGTFFIGFLEDLTDGLMENVTKEAKLKEFDSNGKENTSCNQNNSKWIRP